MSLMNLFHQGGPVMYALLLCSVLGLGLTIERLIYWIQESKTTNRKEVSLFFEAVLRHDWETTQGMAAKTRNPVLAPLRPALMRRDDQSMLELLDLQINQISEKGDQYLVGMETVVAVSPLLGVLGTVMGIVSSFHILGGASIVDPKAVGAGLAEALITTGFGLMIAVPVLVAHNIFASLSRKQTLWLEQFADELEFHVSQQRKEKAQPSAAGED